MEGEGAWTSYIKDDAGATLAYRTFIQPDPKRPYTLVAIVAFNLSRIRLGYVLGTIDPELKGTAIPGRKGIIPAPDFKPDVLLATFNGGFKGEHGAFGAMSDGIVAIPPRDGLATVAMYEDGTIKIGEWRPFRIIGTGLLVWLTAC